MSDFLGAMPHGILISATRLWGVRHRGRLGALVVRDAGLQSTVVVCVCVAALLLGSDREGGDLQNRRSRDCEGFLSEGRSTAQWSCTARGHALGRSLW